MTTSRWSTRGRGRRPILVSIVVLALLMVASLPAAALSTKPTAVKTNMTNGWGDYQNSYSWAMAWYNGKLYVGTARDEMCIEFATYAYYGITAYRTNPAPGVTCPANWMDADLRAEIWQYTPETNNWQMVYQSPTVPNPAAPGKQIAQDIAYRGMVVYQGQLYVLGVTADELIPALQTTSPPRILRTSDGTNFTALNIAPYQISYPNSRNSYQPGPFYPMGYRSYAVYNDQLYVTATPSLTGDGALMRVNDPTGDTTTLTQVSPNTMQIFEIAAFNNNLYIGGADPNSGYFVARTDAAGDTPTFTTVVQNGAGRGKSINSVVSMYVFQNNLYVGASGWYVGTRASELIVVRPDDSWDVVVGNARQTDQGLKSPLSGLPDGFGNPFNAHFWRMQEIQGDLYLGTNDGSWLFSQIPFANLFLGWQYGYDVYYTADGIHWLTATRNAFGSGMYNFGARTMAASDTTGYLGSANQAQGTLVMQMGMGVTSAGAAAGASPSVASPSLNAAGAAMTTVDAGVLPQGTAVVWDAVPGATKYHIYRSDYVSNKVVKIVPAQEPLGNFVDAIVPPTKNDPSGAAADIWLPGQFHEVGTTTNTSFIDRTAKAGGHYAYYVQSEDASGQLSQPSNTVELPSPVAPVSFDSVASDVQALANQGTISQAAASRILAALNQAQDNAAKGNVPAAVGALNRASGMLNGAQSGKASEVSLELQRLKQQVQISGLKQNGK